MIQADKRCEDCLYRLAETLTAFAKEQAPAHLKGHALEDIRRVVEQGVSCGLASPIIANQMLAEIARISGIADLYETFKENELDRAQEVYSRINGTLREDFRSRVELAVIGNTLDFFQDPQRVLEEVPDLVKHGISFFRDDIDRLEDFLSKGRKNILYFTDNSGEIFFDFPLYEALRERSGRCVLVVKGGPALNDMTRKEMQERGLETVFHEVSDTGTIGPGIDWKNASNDFISLVEGADLILSKGMANFETLYSEALRPAVFFLFRVKCEPIRDIAETPMGGFVALWQDGSSKGMG